MSNEKTFEARLFHFVKRAAFIFGLVCLVPVFAKFFIPVPAVLAWIYLAVIGGGSVLLAGVMAFMDGLTHGGIR